MPGKAIGCWPTSVWWIFPSSKTTKLEATDQKCFQSSKRMALNCRNALIRYWSIKQTCLLFYTFLDSLESSLTSPPWSLLSWFSCCQFCPLPHPHACHDPPHAISRTQKGAWSKDSYGSVAGMFCGYWWCAKCRDGGHHRLRHQSKTSSCLHYENWITRLCFSKAGSPCGKLYTATYDKSSRLIARKYFSLSRTILLI